MLTIYNTLTRKKEAFHPIKPGKVGLYVCGLTPYDYIHLGHARTWVAFDVMIRHLKHLGYHTTYIRNFTDIDDKIIKRSQEKQQSYQELTQYFIKAMREDMAVLNVLSPDKEPLATEYIDEMQAIISQLIAKGYAYVGENQDVYYRVDKFKNYGQLSNRTLSDLRSGTRMSVAEEKENPLDFVLWKHAKPQEPYWESPWGKGRPGWHIECSAMSKDCLGPHFDIHGGGGDLLFPHHENEIAQSQACNDQTMANYWLHTGMVNINKEKMSKSLGNFLYLRDILKKHHPEVLRYFLLTSHYRSPINYSEESLLEAHLAMTRLYNTIRYLPEQADVEAGSNEFKAQFDQTMNDDFNTPAALAVLFDLARHINHHKAQSDEKSALKLAGILRALAARLGLLQTNIEVFLQGDSINDTSFNNEVESLIHERECARQNKDWAKADQIRAQLSKMGVIIEDSTQGTSWRRLSEH